MLLGLPLTLRLRLAGGVEAVVVLVLVFLAVVPRLLARVRPTLHQVVEVDLGHHRGGDGRGFSLLSVTGGIARLFLDPLLRLLRRLFLRRLLRRLRRRLRLRHLRERVVELQSTANLVRLLMADEVHAEAHLLHGLVVRGRHGLLRLLLPVGLLPVGGFLVIVELVVAATREALALFGQAILHLLSRALAEVRHARLLGDHAADVLHEVRGVLVLVGEAVARLELVAVAHAKGHLSLLLGESLVGEHELVDLLLEGLLLERLEAGLQRLKALLDDSLLLVCQLVIVVVARAGEERVGDGHVGGGDVLVRGSRDGGHHHVSHDCSPGLGRRRGRVRYRSRETGRFLCAMRANDGEVPCVSFSQRASWSGGGRTAQIVVVFKFVFKKNAPWGISYGEQSETAVGCQVSDNSRTTV